MRRYTSDGPQYSIAKEQYPYWMVHPIIYHNVVKCSYYIHTIPCHSNTLHEPSNNVDGRKSMGEIDPIVRGVTSSKFITKNRNNVPNGTFTPTMSAVEE